MDDNKQFEALSCLRSAVLSPPPAKGMRRTLKQEVSGGKSLSPRGGKHYGQLYRHGLLWHVQKWPNKFADWQRRDGRLRGRRGVTAQQQMFTWPPLPALGRSGHKRLRVCEENWNPGMLIRQLQHHILLPELLQEHCVFYQLSETEHAAYNHVISA